jgi:hypothetical protein
VRQQPIVGLVCAKYRLKMFALSEGVFSPARKPPARRSAIGGRPFLSSLQMPGMADFLRGHHTFSQPG